MESIDIRLATSTDAAALAAIFRRAWAKSSTSVHPGKSGGKRCASGDF